MRRPTQRGQPRGELFRKPGVIEGHSVEEELLDLVPSSCALFLQCLSSPGHSVLVPRTEVYLRLLSEVLHAVISLVHLYQQKSIIYAPCVHCIMI